MALVSDGTNLFLDAALLNLGEHVRLDAATGTEADLAEYDLVLFDLGNNPLPETLPDTHVAVFDPWRFEDSPFPIAKARDVGRPFLTEQVFSPLRVIHESRWGAPERSCNSRRVVMAGSSRVPWGTKRASCLGGGG